MLAPVVSWPIHFAYPIGPGNRFAAPAERRDPEAKIQRFQPHKQSRNWVLAARSRQFLHRHMTKRQVQIFGDLHVMYSDPDGMLGDIAECATIVATQA